MVQHAYVDLRVKVKRLHPDAVIPEYAKLGDAGLDLTAISVEVEHQIPLNYAHDGQKWIFGTGLAIEIPEGYVGFIFPRSSIHKKEMYLTNCVGVIDSGYRGEIKFVFKCNHRGPVKLYKVGDRVGQLIIMPYPTVELIAVEELKDSERGTAGFGSTGT